MSCTLIFPVKIYKESGLWWICDGSHSQVFMMFYSPSGSVYPMSKKVLWVSCHDEMKSHLPFWNVVLNSIPFLKQTFHILVHSMTKLLHIKKGKELFKQTNITVLNWQQNFLSTRICHHGHAPPPGKIKVWQQRSGSNHKICQSYSKNCILHTRLSFLSQIPALVWFLTKARMQWEMCMHKDCFKYN